MRSVHSHTAKAADISKIDDSLTTLEGDDINNRFTFKNASLSPPILIIGTNKEKLTTLNKNEIIEKKFEIIKEFLRNKIYAKHIVEPFFAIDTSENDALSEQAKKKENGHGDDSMKVFYHDIDILRRTIKQVALNEPYMGEQQPLKWMNFEKSLEKLKSKGLFYASLSQVLFFSIAF